jgi:hypothetical protein
VLYFTHRQERERRANGIHTTDFFGSIAVEPPLNESERAYLTKFAETRRMDRAKGPYFVDGSGDFGQGDDLDIRETSTTKLYEGRARSLVRVGFRPTTSTTGLSRMRSSRRSKHYRS